jgi:formylglycine-generating enzyme required for sulfatase activity
MFLLVGLVAACQHLGGGETLRTGGDAVPVVAADKADADRQALREQSAAKNARLKLDHEIAERERKRRELSAARETAWRAEQKRNRDAELESKRATRMAAREAARKAELKRQREIAAREQHKRDQAAAREAARKAELKRRREIAAREQHKRDQEAAAALERKKLAQEKEAAAAAAAVLSAPAPEPEPLSPGQSLKDCPLCPEMVVIAAGSYDMGPTTDSTSPRRSIRIDAAFAVGKFEVTFTEWRACAQGGGCGAYQPADNGWGRGQRPVINVSWRDAKAYVAWLSDKTGQRYRLLGELEWENVARAGARTTFNVGAAIDATQANFRHDCASGSREDCRNQTLPVGRFAANGFGLFDTHGNVWEWTEDCWRPGGAAAAPNCSRRVLRGGSWSETQENLGAANRVWDVINYRSDDVGFRVARELD